MRKITSINEWLENYKWEQPELDMCLTACIKMMLDEISYRHKVPKLKMSLKKINKLCDYRKGLGVPPGEVVPSLNSRLEDYGYIAREEEGVERFNKLKEVLFDEDASIPIVAFGSEYLNSYKKDSYKTIGSTHWDHVVAVIDINEENNIKICDPMEKHLLKSTKLTEIKNNLSIAEFLHYWGGAHPPYWIMWVERKKGENNSLDRWGIWEERIG